MTEPSRTHRLVGGIVAYRDGPRVADAIRSLLGQELPEGWTWRRIWVVVSPDDLGTVEHAHDAARADLRVSVVEEAQRKGKSAALAEILRRADGDLLVLLNGDAAAEPGAVAELVAATAGARPIFGVMARPVPPKGDGRPLTDSLRLLWGLHDRFHVELHARGESGHLSDELFALPIANLPPFRPGIITDGAFAAAWIRSHGGELRYARKAVVRLSLPARLQDHVEQRRRIHVGHWQVQQESGRPPTTLASMGIHQEGRVIRLIRSEMRGHPHPWRSLALLLTAEIIAGGLARWDIARQRKGYAVWPRVALAEAEPRGESSAAGAPG